MFNLPLFFARVQFVSCSRGRAMTSEKNIHISAFHEEPVTERLDYFDNLIVGHARLVAVLAELLNILSAPEPPLIVGVIGPTGVGKSTLLHLVKQRLLELALEEMERDPGFIPVADVIAMASEFAGFQWEDYYRHTLEALEEPLIDAKALYPGQYEHIHSPGKPSRVTLALRYALEQCLRYRQTKVLLIDEAQHIARMAKGITINDQAHKIVTLVKASMTTHVLFGNYELLELLYTIEALGATVKVLRFRNYRWEDTADRLDFEHLVFSFQSYLPFAETPDPIVISDLYRGCCGCTGMLKLWLADTLRTILQEGEHTLTRTQLYLNAVEKSKLLQIAREIKAEDLAFSNIKHGKLLNSTNDSCPSHSTSSSGSKKHTRRVGERNPARDKVGK